MAIYMDLLRAKKGEPLSSEFSTDGSLISASAVPHCRGSVKNAGLHSRVTQRMLDCTHVQRIQDKIVLYSNEICFKQRVLHSTHNLFHAETVGLRSHTTCPMQSENVGLYSTCYLFLT